MCWYWLAYFLTHDALFGRLSDSRTSLSHSGLLTPKNTMDRSTRVLSKGKLLNRSMSAEMSYPSFRLTGNVCAIRPSEGLCSWVESKP